MPLRDHFHPPLSNRSSWEGFHGMWPALIVLKLLPHLPSHFTAEPRVLVGAEYEVLVYDQHRDRELAAAVELVVPANKSRPKNRAAFVAKCASFLKRGVCVSILDIVTSQHFNFYSELLRLTNSSDSTFGPNPPVTYAVTCRRGHVGDSPKTEIWAHALEVGSPLPALPLWLADDVAISLDVEDSYQDTCRALRIP